MKKIILSVILLNFNALCCQNGIESIEFFEKTNTALVRNDLIKIFNEKSQEFDVYEFVNLLDEKK